MRRSPLRQIWIGRPTLSFSILLYVSFLCLGGFAEESSRHSVASDEIQIPTQPKSEMLEQPQSRPPKTITSFSTDTIDSMVVVEQHLQDEDYDKAEKKLEEVWQQATELSLSEKAEVKYMSGRVTHIQQNVEATIGFLESVLEYRDNISYAREEEVLLRLSELHLSKKQYGKAHSRLNDWLQIVEQPQAGELAYAGSLFAKTKDFEQAKQFLSDAIEQQREKGVDIDTRWSELLEFVEKQLGTAK